MEKLYQLASDSDYDLIVLDTPPTANALDFLDAPARLIDFLGNDAARALLAPALGAGRLGLRLAQLGGGYAAKALARFTGQQALADLGQFLQASRACTTGSRPGRPRSATCSPARRSASSSSPRRAPAPSSRRARSTTGSRPSPCRWRAWWSTGSHRSCGKRPPPCQGP